MKEIITERPNLFEPNVYITMCVEIAGNVCPHRLAAAVREACQANEAAMSAIVLEQGIACYERQTVSGCRTEITDKNWTEIVRENEKRPFAIDKGELIRTFVIPSGQETRLVVMAHHLAGDGKALIYFIKDIMQSLAGIPLTYKPLSILTRDSFSETRLPIPVRAYLRYCRHKWKNAVFTWQDYYELHEKYWKEYYSDIQCQTLSAAETEQIIQEAKRIGCSVNSYLVTLFLQIYGKKCEAGIPVSIRDSTDESLSNLTSGIRIKYRYDPKKTFAENAVRVHGKIREELQQRRIFVLQFLSELPATLIDAVLLRTHGCCSDRLAARTAKRMGYIGNRTRDLGITNLTRLDIPVLYGSCQIQNILFVPPAVSYAHNIIGISTVNGKMTISFHNMVKYGETLSLDFDHDCISMRSVRQHFPE